MRTIKREKVYTKASVRINTGSYPGQYIFLFIIQASPGDPIDNYVRPGMTEEQIEDIKEEYELDGSMAQQYSAGCRISCVAILEHPYIRTVR